MPGLRREVEHALRGVYETAAEYRRLNRSAYDLNDRFIRTRVGSYMVSYVLDMELAIARGQRHDARLQHKGADDEQPERSGQRVER